jgi:hypothetical protein
MAQAVWGSFLISQTPSKLYAMPHFKAYVTPHFKAYVMPLFKVYVIPRVVQPLVKESSSSVALQTKKNPCQRLITLGKGVYFPIPLEQNFEANFACVVIINFGRG